MGDDESSAHRQTPGYRPDGPQARRVPAAPWERGRPTPPREQDMTHDPYGDAHREAPPQIPRISNPGTGEQRRLPPQPRPMPGGAGHPGEEGYPVPDQPHRAPGPRPMPPAGRPAGPPSGPWQAVPPRRDQAETWYDHDRTPSQGDQDPLRNNPMPRGHDHAPRWDDSTYRLPQPGLLDSQSPLHDQNRPRPDQALPGYDPMPPGPRGHEPNTPHWDNSTHRLPHPGPYDGPTPQDDGIRLRPDQALPGYDQVPSGPQNHDPDAPRWDGSTYRLPPPGALDSQIPQQDGSGTRPDQARSGYNRMPSGPQNDNPDIPRWDDPSFRLIQADPLDDQAPLDEETRRYDDRIPGHAPLPADHEHERGPLGQVPDGPTQRHAPARPPDDWTQLQDDAVPGHEQVPPRHHQRLPGHEQARFVPDQAPLHDQAQPQNSRDQPWYDQALPAHDQGPAEHDRGQRGHGPIPVRPDRVPPRRDQAPSYDSRQPSTGPNAIPPREGPPQQRRPQQPRPEHGEAHARPDHEPYSAQQLRPPHGLPQDGRPVPPQAPPEQFPPQQQPPQVAQPRQQPPPQEQPLRGRPPAQPARVRAGEDRGSRPTTKGFQKVDVAEATGATAGDDTSGGKSGGNAKLLRDSGSIAFATLISRITGFGKQLLLLAVLGPAIASAFTSASLIPNMIAELVLGAVLTAIVVPTLVRAEQEDADGGAAFIRRLCTAAFVVLATAALLATAMAPLLATHVFVAADGKVNTALTTALTFLLLPAVLFYGLSALLTAILNTRQVFRPGAWAPVLNNLVVLAVLGLYALTPGEITLDPVRMSDPKLLVLGCGVTLGVIIQAVSLLPAIRRQGIDLRPLWGLDARLKQFGTMAAAIILYVLISQIGAVVANHISSQADAAGPAIYQNAWLLLQLPYGVLGVTLLTAIMPRLSRNAAADDTPAVVDDLSVATRLTMIALIPIVTFLTLAGPQVGQALMGYGRFAEDAERLGMAVAWSAFTLIPYSLVLIHLRVFYAREQAWTPTWIILGITAVKIVFSALAPLVASSSEQVVIVLGVATGLGFTTGALIGGYLLHRSLGDLRMANVGRTITRVLLASIAGGAVMLIADKVLGLDRLTQSFGGPGSFVRVVITAIVMFAVAFGLMRLIGIPEIVAITVAISRKLGITAPAPALDLDEPVEDEYATQVLRRPDPYLAYSSFDPYMDTQTMVLPVIRPDSVDNTGGGAFPYPVRQRSTSGEFAGVATYQGEGGPRVSDDAVGDVPAADYPAKMASGLSTDVPPNQADPYEPASPQGDAGPPGRESAQDSDQDPGDRELPPRDPMYDTGMIPVSVPQMPPPGPEMGPPRRSPRGPKLMPGASVAGGRYRLLADHGGTRGLRFWQALDIKLDREVALTFVDADQKAADNSGQDGPQAILSRTLRLGRINSPGLARVLDVVRGSSGGIVVAEWTPGRSLREMAETVPSPIGAARAVRALASAAELAHRSGGALSIDHPDRVRISAAGDAVLAFPGTLGDADPQGDVRGLGAMLYALITARWPIRTGVSGAAAAVGGLHLADFGPDGSPVEPRQIRPDVPFEISAVAVRSLDSSAGVRTAATVQHVLEQASVVDQKTDFIPVLRLGQRAPASADDSLADPELLAAEREKSQRMMWIMVGLGILTALVVGIVIWWMVSIFAPGDSSEPLNEQVNIGLTTDNAPSSTPAAPAPTAGTTTAAEPGVAVPVGSVSVFSPEGTPDSPENTDAVLDDDPSTMWRTDQYFQQFPALKNGVGLLATLQSPAKLNKIAITSPSPGTTVEIRTSSTTSPTLDQTRLIGTARLGEGVTEISLNTDQPARYVLVWITGLGNSDGQFQTAIADLRFDAAR